MYLSQVQIHWRSGEPQLTTSTFKLATVTVVTIIRNPPLYQNICQFIIIVMPITESGVAKNFWNPPFTNHRSATDYHTCISVNLVCQSSITSMIPFRLLVAFTCSLSHPLHHEPSHSQLVSTQTYFCMFIVVFPLSSTTALWNRS